MSDLIERLRTHNDERLYHEADALMSEAAAELERLRADAARYRWLRDRVPEQVFSLRGTAAGCWIDCEDEDGELVLVTGADADAAIDAAMKGTP